MLKQWRLKHKSKNNTLGQTKNTNKIKQKVMYMCGHSLFQEGYALFKGSEFWLKVG